MAKKASKAKAPAKPKAAANPKAASKPKAAAKPKKDWRAGLSQGEIEAREACERDEARGGPGL